MIVRFFKYLALLWRADEYGWPGETHEAADARRYRWLKMKCSPGAQTQVMQATPWLEWDDKIDRYMNDEPHSPPGRSAPSNGALHGSAWLPKEQGSDQ